jgi:hypothetical protein
MSERQPLNDEPSRGEALPPAARGSNTDQPAPVEAESCDWCGSTDLWWRNCKLLCRGCNAIVKSCADL